VDSRDISIVKRLMFCPNCSTRLKTPEAESCVNCGAVFGEDAAWTPIAAPLRGSGKEKPFGLARSGFAILLIFVCMCFLRVSFAMKGTVVGSTPALILAMVFGASGFVVVMAKTSKARDAAAAAGLIVLVVVAMLFGSVMVRLLP
jgi:hypothetical protein